MAVIFRFQFNSEEAPRLLRVYEDKWRALTRYVFSKQRTRNTYKRLDLVRNSTPRDFKTSDVIGEVSKVDASGARLLLDCSVLFDVSPYDLRCFILAVLGCSKMGLNAEL